MEHFIPLSEPAFRGNEKEYVENVIEQEWVSTAGARVSDFEAEIARYNGKKYGIACANGTSALHIALIESGVQREDEVIVPTVTFIAPVNTVSYLGAVPVFMDCDEYLNIDVKKVEEFVSKECVFDGDKLINKHTGRRIKAVLPVHVFGNPVDLEHLMYIAERYKLMVIEDATESLGSFYKNGRYKNKKPVL
jgi:dTDP-4-amino-4,6-dideoxygalactose transaminase